MVEQKYTESPKIIVSENSPETKLKTKNPFPARSRQNQSKKFLQVPKEKTTKKDLKSKDSNTIVIKKSRHLGFIKSKKNSFKRGDLRQSRRNKGFGSLQRKMKIRLDMSHRLDNDDIEYEGLKSCSMKNTVNQFKFEKQEGFGVKKKSDLAYRDKSMNLMYGTKNRLKRNHTTKLLRPYAKIQRKQPIIGSRYKHF